MLLIRKKGDPPNKNVQRPNGLLHRPANAKRIVHRRHIAITATTSSEVPMKAGFQRPMIKRRAYGKAADLALKTSSLGAKRRFDGMQKLLARAGRGLFFKLPETGVTLPSSSSSDTENESDNDDEAAQEEAEQPFEPLELWKSPHLGGIAKGLPPKPKTVIRPDEYGIEEEVTVLSPVEIDAYAKTSVFVPPVLCKKLRPHQREGVQFMYECVMGIRDFAGNGCILADDMGLGKTLQSLTVIYTLLKTGITADGVPTCKRVIVVCPCSLVKNWESEFQKWLGIHNCKVLALAEADRKTMEKNIDCFCRTKMFQVLIVSYEGIRGHIKRFQKHADCCDLLVCDEAHRLKNSENQTSRALNSLPVKRRILLTGTPMQNDLQEFYAMVDFTNPGILGTLEEFRRRILFPVLRGREPDATPAQKEKMIRVQADMSAKCTAFILRRFNTLNAQHLPPKLVQVVCCNLTDIQKNMYEHLVNSKDAKHMLDGKQENCLGAIQLLMKLANHPSLVVDDDADWKKKHGGAATAAGKNQPQSQRRGAAQKIQYCDSLDEKETANVPGADGIAKFLPCVPRGTNAPVHPEWSGKMYVLYRLMKEMRKPGNGGDKIVIISNYTSTLDLIGRMCRENSWGFCRLDGSVSMKKRMKMVEDFNDPSSPLIAFLLSSKAGGCGLNLIGGNRLVLFDPDWNPAVDKQAAARCWRDGQQKRCFTYRFLATGTVEEKIFQRQLSKEGLQSVVDDKEQVNTLSTKDLRNLFKLRIGTPSDTHDKLRCERCQIVQDSAELEATKALPKKLLACGELLENMAAHPDAQFFLTPLDPTQHGRTKEEYEALVKQPMDLESIRKKLSPSPGTASPYGSIADFAKDVNRIFSNIVKVWEDGEEIADASKRLQIWWLEEWTELVPRLMTMKAEDDKDDAETKEESIKKLDPLDEVLDQCANVHNERGEDYQEQIGMPDEENMRNWSHHFSTDTCDDPVFRAAMRGTDIVSFVFGLEVTYSLIKAREEQERELREMEAMENFDESQVSDNENDKDDEAEEVNEDDECDEMDDDRMDLAESNSSSRQKRPAAALADSDQDDSEDENGDEEMKDFIIEDNEGDEDDDERSSEEDDSECKIDSRNVAEQDNVSPGRASHPLDNVNSKTDHSDDRSLAGSAACHSTDLECSQNDASLDGSTGCSHHDGKTETGLHSSSENTGEVQEDSEFENAAAAPVAGKWSCSSCTFLNKKSSRKCAMCSTRKPAGTQSTGRRPTKKRSLCEVVA